MGRTIVRVLIDYRPALVRRTGVGAWVHGVVSGLAEAAAEQPALDLTIFSSSWKDRLGPVVEGVRRHDGRVPVRVLNFAWHRLGCPPVEWLTGRSYDIVHSPHPLLIPTRRARRVVTVHDLDFLDHPDRAEAEIRRDYPRLVRRHVQRADQVIVPSAHTAAEVTGRLGVPADRVTVCYNGAPAWQPRATAPSNGHVLYVGALTPRKNIDGLLDAYAVLLDRAGDGVPPLVLAGPTPARPPAWMTRLDQAPLHGRVQRTGYLDSAALLQAYRQAAVLVLPSLNEGFGRPALEAMAAGVPVVASNRGALPEVVGDAGLLVDPLDPTAVALAIERLLRDPTLARTCAARGVDRAARFTWRASAAALRGAYQAAWTR